MAEYDVEGWQVHEHEPERTAEDVDSAALDGAPAPWYRKRVLLTLWALMVALLVTLLIYGIVELSRGGETGGPATTTTSTTPARSSTSPTSSPPTTTETPPPPETPEQTPEEAPPPANNSPSPAPPPRHHHHLHLPHWF